MSEKELLELAAKAAGIEVTDAMRELWEFEGSSAWNPLHNDADALRLAVQRGCKIEVLYELGRTIVTCGSKEVAMAHMRNPERATRSAIVRAVAMAGSNVGITGDAKANDQSAAVDPSCAS